MPIRPSSFGGCQRQNRQIRGVPIPALRSHLGGAKSTKQISGVPITLKTKKGGANSTEAIKGGCQLHSNKKGEANCTTTKKGGAIPHLPHPQKKNTHTFPHCITRLVRPLGARVKKLGCQEHLIKKWVSAAPGAWGPWPPRTRTRTRTNTLPIAVGKRGKRRRLSPKTSARACAVWCNARNARVL